MVALTGTLSSLPCSAGVSFANSLLTWTEDISQERQTSNYNSWILSKPVCSANRTLTS